MVKILMVLTSHDVLGNTGRKTGFWQEEFAAPYFVFGDAGVQVTLASPKGGQPPIDPKSD
jgi:putative intracellular protease/amidase